MKKTHFWFAGLAMFFCAGSLLFSWYLQSSAKGIIEQSKVLYGLVFSAEKDGSVAEQTKVIKAKSSFCKALAGVPYAEDLGILKSVRRITIADAFAPHNASIVEDGDGYLLFFRYDVKEKKQIAGVDTPFKQKIAFYGKKMPYRTFIGAVRLDKEFKQSAPVQKIDTHSDFSEDPRGFRAGEKLYLSYNDMQKSLLYSRTMHLAEIDPYTLETQFVLDIDQHIQHVDQVKHIEKNWVPFVRQEETGERKIYFEYGINPHKILRMKEPNQNEMDHLIFPHTIAFQKTPWKIKWGGFRGGTPAKRIGNQYLAFFHTLFYEKKIPWYVMGAYTFEANPPYRITAISQTPILFKGIYDTKTKNT